MLSSIVSQPGLSWHLPIWNINKHSLYFYATLRARWFDASCQVYLVSVKNSWTPYYHQVVWADFALTLQCYPLLQEILSVTWIMCLCIQLQMSCNYSTPDTLAWSLCVLGFENSTIQQQYPPELPQVTYKWGSFVESNPSSNIVW